MNTVLCSPPARIPRTSRILLASGMLGSLFITTAQAEWYVGGYGGIANPGAFSNVTASNLGVGNGFTNARLNDLELKSTFVGGAKGGYFFESRPWLGLETDVYTLKPTVKTQTVVGGTSSGTVFAENLGPIPLQLTTWAIDLIIRSPSLSEVFQPYGGMGYGLFFASSSKNGQSNLNISPGFNLIAGARYALSPQWAFFGEFKFNRATIRFSDIRGNYDSQLFVFGLMWHNRDKY